jgi:transposase-like protein
MTNKSNTQKTYTEEFKRDAVRLAGERGNIAAVRGNNRL